MCAVYCVLCTVCCVQFVFCVLCFVLRHPASAQTSGWRRASVCEALFSFFWGGATEVVRAPLSSHRQSAPTLQRSAGAPDTHTLKKWTSSVQLGKVSPMLLATCVVEPRQGMNLARSSVALQTPAWSKKG